MTFREQSVLKRFCELAFQQFLPSLFSMQKGNKNQRVHRLGDFKSADRFLQPVTKNTLKNPNALIPADYTLLG